MRHISTVIDTIPVTPIIAVRRAVWFPVVLSLLAFACAAPAPSRAMPCSALRALPLGTTTITSAEVVDSGKFVPPAMVRRASPEFFTAFNTLPTFCRVRAVARPSNDSDINIEVWLPVNGWNGRYLGVGNGTYGGSISYYRLGESLHAGYATSSTDTGHRGAPSDTAWSVGHPEKQADFDYRAVHETAQLAKALIQSFYSKPPTRSYFASCSNGGRQGIMEAERYPSDYDGVFSGAPALHWGFRTFPSGNLGAFEKRGGKIIVYHGGNDHPEANIEFLSSLRKRMGDTTVRNFLQLYIVPGMGHCGSGDEPNDIGQWVRIGDNPQHSLFSALEQWVENGVTPDGVIATKFAVDGDPSSRIVKTARLCPYPQTAKWNRTGSVLDAASYECP